MGQHPVPRVGMVLRSGVTPCGVLCRGVALCRVLCHGAQWHPVPWGGMVLCYGVRGHPAGCSAMGQDAQSMGCCAVRQGDALQGAELWGGTA